MNDSEKETSAEQTQEMADEMPQETDTASEAESTAEEAPKAETEEENAEEQPAEEVKKKSGLFGKDRKLQKELDESRAAVAELNDRVMRQMAEFDNFRKRTEKEKSAMFEIGARSILEKMLPIVDSFERGLNGLSEEQKAEPFAAGMELVYKQFLKMMEDAEVKPIEAVGKTFDPNFHNAVMHVDDENVPDNTVVEEFMKGYTYRDTVIRFSMVKVAN